MTQSVTIVGAGAWGTALAQNFAMNRLRVHLWGRDEDQLNQIESGRENTHYLPSIRLSNDIVCEASLSSAVSAADIVLMVIPAQHMRSVAVAMAPNLKNSTTIISCAKGIEQRTGDVMSNVLKSTRQNHTIATLSGPSFAADVARGLPTAVTIAANNMSDALALCEILSNRQLRCYASDDLAGVDYGGALKNVLAIAAGMVHGRQLGASALAAITARGFAELQTVALALGAKPETLTGLSGLGDLILTCASEKSRNFAYGAAFGRGDDVSNLKLAEGVATAKVAAKIVRDNAINAPLIETISAVLDGALSLDNAMDLLMNRPVKPEASRA